MNTAKISNKEVWRPVVGSNGLYCVSNYGRVISHNNYNRKSSILLKPFLSKQGYLRINLRLGHVAKHKQVATIVASAFIPNPNGFQQVNHKDENKTNNFVWVNEDGTIDPDRSNLEWCTCKQNINHGTRNKRMVETRTRLGQSRGERAVVQLSLSGDLISIYRSTMEAERQTGAYSSLIGKCCKGIFKQHHGYVWKYLEDYNQ